ncbi:hypothetical protein Slu03_16720 [Sediminihabitans luteus]|nr:hypothetical protein Slu03_16720 [Sediminihabitans luteus]
MRIPSEPPRGGSLGRWAGRGAWPAAGRDEGRAVVLTAVRRSSRGGTDGGRDVRSGAADVRRGALDGRETGCSPVFRVDCRVMRAPERASSAGRGGRGTRGCERPPLAPTGIAPSGRGRSPRPSDGGVKLGGIAPRELSSPAMVSRRR